MVGTILLMQVMRHSINGMTILLVAIAFTAFIKSIKQLDFLFEQQMFEHFFAIVLHVNLLEYSVYIVYQNILVFYANKGILYPTPMLYYIKHINLVCINDKTKGAYYMKKNWLLLIVLLLSLVVAACAGGSKTEEKEKDAPKDKEEASNENSEGKPVEGGDLVLAVHSEASTLDPAGSNDVPSTNVQFNIFETLVKKDEENNIVPGLAKSWEPVDDRTFEFKLQEGVKFHDGEDFNAEAVKKSLDRILDPEVASSKYNTFEMIESVDVVDEYTVRITTEYPFSPILTHLSHSGGAIISPKVIDEDYEAAKNGREIGAVVSEKPTGTGYFKFDSWTPGSEIKLVRNDDYWGDKAHVDSVTFRVVPESTTRNADLERGFVQIVDNVQPNEVQALNDSDFASVTQTASTALTFIGFNTEKAPFDDARVRQAISKLVNKQEIIDGIYNGFAIPAEGPLAPKVVGYSDSLKGYDYDPEGAIALLKEAGYEDGFDIVFWTNDNPQRVETAVYLQDVLKEYNINIEIKQLEFGAYIENLRAGEHNLYMLSWSNSLADGDNGLYSLFHSSTKGVPPNAFFYGTEEVDNLLNEARIETEPAKRAELYVKAQEKLIEDAPTIFLNHPEYLTGVSNSITGFAVDTSNQYLLQNVQFVE